MTIPRHFTVNVRHKHKSMSKNKLSATCMNKVAHVNENVAVNKSNCGKVTKEKPTPNSTITYKSLQSLAEVMV